MSYINLKNDAPGILGLMAFRPESALAINNLAETLLRGPSTLSQGERELIGGCVSYWNDCNFCHRAHAAVAEFFLEKELGFTEMVSRNVDAAPISPKMKSLLKLAKKVQVSGRSVQSSDVNAAKDAGATDVEIHDAILIASMFCMVNRYVDGHGTFAPETGASYYAQSAIRLGVDGYMAPKPKAL